MDYNEMKSDLYARTDQFKRADMAQRTAFYREYRSANFITPDIHGLFALNGGRYLAEVSTGRGMSNQPIYGVTVMIQDGSAYQIAPEHMNKCLARSLDVSAYLRELDKAPALNGE